MHIFQIILPEEIVSPHSINIDGDKKAHITRFNHRHIYEHVEFPTNTLDYKNLFGFDLSKGEISNFLSHRSVWERFATTPLPWCLIVESNVSLPLSMQDLVQTVEELPVGWDVFFPYDRKTNFINTHIQSNGSTLINKNTWEYTKQEPYLPGYKVGNSIYLLSKSGTEKLLNIDTITDRLDHTILKMTEKENSLNVYASDADWFDPNRMEDYEWPDRCQSIFDLAVSQGEWNNLRLSRVRNLLKIISDIGIQKNIDLMLDAGTLLSYIRHGEMMLWDDDVDIGIEEKNLPVFFEEIEKHKNICHAGGFKFRGTTYYKIWDTEGEEIEKYPYTFPFIDIWAYSKKGNDIAYENGNVYPDAARHDPEEVLFEGSSYKIPWNALEVLDSRYVDWRKMIRVYTWCHREEKNNFKYLYIPIKTDETGRMIPFSGSQTLKIIK